jgi:cullin 1
MSTCGHGQIEKATTLATEILDPNLSILLKAKVLIASPEGAKPEPSTSFTLNYNFKSKKVKVNLNRLQQG